MADRLSNAKQVYYSFRDPTTGTIKIVPVRGVYVTGEWKPPSYIEPTLNLLHIKTNHSTIEDFTEKTESPISTASHHLYDIDLDATFRIDLYTTDTAPNQMGTATHHLYDIDLDATFYIEEYQSTVAPNQIGTATHHLYDVDISNDIGTYTVHPKINAGSQPEPILRLIELNVSGVTIENT